MKRIEQGVLDQYLSNYRCIIVLWLILFSCSHPLFAETRQQDTKLPAAAASDPAFHQVILLYSASSTLQSEIAQHIRQSFSSRKSNIALTEITSPEAIASASQAELVIAIGLNWIASLNNYFPDAGKLFIANNPKEYSSADKSGYDGAVLYMSQPFCRQIRFIKQINSRWHTFSYLRSNDNPIDDAKLSRCANKYGMSAYKVVTSQQERLTYYLKDALSHSDLILAIPDETIYNSKSVKNILLTSYRNRKPIIAFSGNFVIAGALASIHSEADQIADSAVNLVEKYFISGRHFTHRINYPRSFDISINKQVFRALDLGIPDVNKIARALNEAPANTGGVK
jgi:ABC-type uncharacterized transport system substrate-binding protein